MKKKLKMSFPLLCVFSLLATYLSKLETSLKILPIICIYILLFKYYKHYRFFIKFRGWYKIIFFSYVGYCLFLILRSVFYDSNSGLMGIYTLSLFGNLEFGVLNWILPIAILIVFDDSIISSYAKICDVIIVLGILGGLLYFSNVDSTAFDKIFYLLPVVCPRLLLSKKRHFLYWVYFAISFLYCYIEDERSILGMNILCIMGLLVFKVFKKRKKIINLVIIYSCIVPIVGVSLTTINLISGNSIFTILEDKYGAKSNMSQDTRTFLFVELNEDLTQNNSWIYGKGIFGTYYSQVMHNALMRKDYSDNENRLGTESGYLWLLLKGGIVLFMLYVLLFYTAIIRGNKSGNNWIIFLSFIMANRLLLMFVSFTPSFDVSNILFWLFLMINIQYNKKYDNINNNSNMECCQDIEKMS